MANGLMPAHKARVSDKKHGKAIARREAKRRAHEDAKAFADNVIKMMGLI